MSSDNEKSHTKTVINLSKPYHRGVLQIDLKNRNIKPLIDIKPILKPNEKLKICDNIKNIKLDKKENTIKNQPNTFINQIKSSTLDYDKLRAFDESSNPFSSVDSKKNNHWFNDIQNQTDTKPLQKQITQLTNIVNKVKQLEDIKKIQKNINVQSILNLQPKIYVSPLHSRSRVLVLENKNSNLTKKLKKWRQRDENKVIAENHKTDLNNFRTIPLDDNFTNISNSDFFHFKAPPKFSSSDIPLSSFYNKFEEISNISKQTDLPELSGEINKSKLRKKIRLNNRIKRYSVSALFTTIIIIFCTLFLTGNAQWMGKFGEKNAQADKIKNEITKKYNEWIVTNNAGKYSPPSNDLDSDGINNYKEFQIGTNPNSKNSCNPSITDSQNLLNLINPATCQPIDFNISDQVTKFKDILNLASEFVQKSLDKSYSNSNFSSSSIQIKNSIIALSQSSSSTKIDILPKIENNLSNNFEFINTRSYFKNAEAIQLSSKN